MIVVTGGNGQLGRAIAASLEQHAGPSAFRLSVRKVVPDDPLAARGIEIRAADYDDPAALARSFEGADQLVLISTDGVDEVRLPRQLNAVRAAKDAGVEHILFTSSSTVGKAPGLAHAEVNAWTEEAIAATGADYTILRNNLYAELLLMFAEPAIETGTICLPAGDAGAAMISRPEIATFAVRALGAGLKRNKIYELTGPAAFGYADLASVLSERTGRTVVYEHSTPEKAVAWIKGRLAVPDFYLPHIVAAAEELGAGWLAPTSPDFERVIGKPAEPAIEVWRRALI